MENWDIREEILCAMWLQQWHMINGTLGSIWNKNYPGGDEGLLIWIQLYCGLHSTEAHSHLVLMGKNDQLSCPLSICMFMNWNSWSVYQTASLIKWTNKLRDHLLKEHRCHLRQKSLQHQNAWSAVHHDFKFQSPNFRPCRVQIINMWSILWLKSDWIIATEHG